MTEPTSAPQAHPPAALVRAVRHLLAPLVRLLLTHGGSFPFLSELLKGVYLEVAEAELRRSGERVTASRLNLWTGVHRKDIRRLRAATPADYAPPASVSLGARLVARWTGEPEFCDADGHPRTLPRQSDEEASFESLVGSVSTDIRPRAVLDEWLRLGIVDLDDADRVSLRHDAFVPREGFDELAHYFGRNLHDHLAAAAHNVSGGPPMLERSVYYEGLSEQSVDELARLAETHGMAALHSVNRRALELKRADEARSETPAPTGRNRINFGTFFFRKTAPGDDDV